eukprot:4358594-Prymnesium_polylepis.3
MGAKRRPQKRKPSFSCERSGGGTPGAGERSSRPPRIHGPLAVLLRAGTLGRAATCGAASASRAP